MTCGRETSNVKRISSFTRDSRELREMRDWSEVLSFRVAPVAHTTNRAYQSMSL
jgi:hypothetical protein